MPVRTPDQRDCLATAPGPWPIQVQEGYPGQMKTRLLHLHWSGGIGGIERWLLTLSRYLDRERFDLTIALMNRSGVVLDEAKREGTRVIEFGWRSGRSPLKALALRRFLQREEFDLVHNHLRTWLVAWALKSTPQPKIIQEHGLLLYHPAKSQGMYNQFGHLYDRFIVTNPEMGTRLAEAVPHSRGRTTLLHNPVDLRDFNPGGIDLANEAEHVVIGGLGRLDHDKDWPLFVRTAQAIRARHPNARFQIMGDGPLAPYVRGMIVEAGMADAVELLPPSGEPAAFYRNIDLLLFTSSREDFGMVIPEALASGTPVVMAPLEAGGAGSLLAGLPGTHVSESRDPESLAVAVTPLLHDPNRRRTSGLAGRAAVEARFGADRWITRLEAVYADLTSAL